MPLLSVSAHDIDAAGLALDADLPVAWLEEELRDAALSSAAPGHVTARLSSSGADVVVRGRIKAALTTPCARCTEPSAVPVDTELTLLLRPAKALPHTAHRVPDGKDKAANGKARPAAPGYDGAASGPKPRASAAPKEIEYEFTSEEADVDAYDGETVVLDPFVREAILLEVPHFPLCSEGCPGIGAAPPAPATSEAGPRVDPRLAPLAALRAKLQRSEKRRSTPPPAAEKTPKKPKKNKE
jgi:uncharacterized protein